MSLLYFGLDHVFSTAAPSFADGVLKCKDENEDFSDDQFRGRSHYTPVYTYYNWNSPKSDKIQMDNETSVFS